MTVRWTWMLSSAVVLTLSVLDGAVATAQDADAAADDAKAKSIEPKLEENPLLTEPRSAETLFDAVVLMSDLARPNLARMYLLKLMESNLNEEGLLKLRDSLAGAAS